MKLENMGFYTLNDKRALTSSSETNLKRCELVITNKCNFGCPECPVANIKSNDISIEEAKQTLDYWIDNGVETIQFSGGEPTLHSDLPELVKYCKNKDVKNIVLATNGTADIHLYTELIKCGVSEFSVSIYSHCFLGVKIPTEVNGFWMTIIKNIQKIAKKSRITVGLDFSSTTSDDIVSNITFISALGADDIRLTTNEPVNEFINELNEIPTDVLLKHPILKYRVQKIINNASQPGVCPRDSSKCYLVLDDITVSEGNHYPCMIYMRNGGQAIGKVSKDMRGERKNWVQSHNAHKDSICSKNCLAICVAFNNKANTRFD